MTEREQLHFRREQFIELFERQGTIVPDRNETQLCADPFRQKLPGHQIAMVLHLRQQDHIARPEKFAAPCLRDEVDALGRSEERRVGKECSCRWSPYHERKKEKPKMNEQCW